MFDVIPYWMWAASLLVLALVCGAALSAQESGARSMRAASSGAARQMADAVSPLSGLLRRRVRTARNVTLRRNALRKSCQSVSSVKK